MFYNIEQKNSTPYAPQKMQMQSGILLFLILQLHPG